MYCMICLIYSKAFGSVVFNIHTESTCFFKLEINEKNGLTGNAHHHLQESCIMRNVTLQGVK